MKRKPKLIIFDLDGTLVDAYQAVYESMNYAINEIGGERISKSLIKKSVGRGEQALLRKFVSEKNFKRCLTVYRAHHKKSLIGNVHYLKNVESFLTWLRQERFQLAIGSNRPIVYTNIILRGLNIRSWFRSVVCGDRVPNAKPAPDIILKIMQQLNRSKEEIVYVGDMTLDVQAAKAAKVTSVAVATGSCTKEELVAAKPDYLFHHMGEFKKLLQGV